MLSEQEKGYMEVDLMELSIAKILGSGSANRWRRRSKRRGGRLQRAIDVMWLVSRGKSRLNEMKYLSFEGQISVLVSICLLVFKVAGVINLF